MGTRISELPDDEAGALLLKHYRAAHEAVKKGDCDGPHPCRDVQRWADIGKSAGKGEDEGGLGPVEIFKRGSADRDVQPAQSVTGGGRPAGNNGPKPAQDGQFSMDSTGNPRFVRSDGVVISGDAALVAHAQQMDPDAIRQMVATIPGYGRLR